MAHIIPNGRAGHVRITSLAAFFFLIFTFSFPAFGQSPTCTAGATAPAVHAEGLAELLGSVGITCFGGVAGSTVSSTVFVQLPVNITNRVDPSNDLLGATYAFSPGATVMVAPPVLNGSQSLVFSPVSYTVPNPSNQSVTITLGGIRAAVATAPGAGGNAFLYGTVTAPGFGLSGALPFPMALPTTSLLSSVLNYGIPCTGSTLPSTINFANLNGAGTSVSTIRITEASPAAFAPLVQGVGSDFGVRFLVSLSGYGPNAQVYMPDVIVGSSGTVQTSAGAYSTSPNGGTYTFGANQLLLVRVAGADTTGMGGALVTGAPGGVTNFTSVSQINMTNGAGFATYEVVDANPNLIESAQIPVFVGVPPSSCTTVQANTLNARLAPVSNVSVTSATAPIPRYIATTPASDCTYFTDCNAQYFPALLATPASITLNSSSLGQTQTAVITVNDGGQSQLTYNAVTTYQIGTNQSVANWLSVNGSSATGNSVTGIVDPAIGITASSLSLSASPAALLIPGTYQATVTITAGTAGTVAIPVTFNVAPAGPVIQALVNGASFQPGAVSAGSVASIFGVNLAPKTSTPATVTFSGSSATILYDGAGQINVLVPTALGSTATAGVIATIDGVASNTFPITLAPNAPAVFNSGILNQNSTVNSTLLPASAGDEIQIFLTGLATPVTLPVTVNIGSVSLTGSQLIYLGPAPGITGLEQINVQVPAGLTGSSAPLSICVSGASGQQTCSPQVSLYLH